MSKELKITVVTYEEFTDYEFIPMATWYVMDSLQNYHFIHTSKREVAQQWANETFGENRYSVKASKIQKGRSKQENGEVSVRGTSTRRGQKK